MMRADLPPLPERMRGQPIDARGYPVPWFVEWHDGKPIFEMADRRKWVIALKEGRCWVCGGRMGTYKAFLIGPMCGINRITSEPASHRECAEWSVRACPFMSRPMAKRTSHKIAAEDKIAPAGVMIERNPGVTLLWVTKAWRTVTAHNGKLIQVGPPTECIFYREGRLATKAEVLASVESGLPLLQQAAEKDGKAGMAALCQSIATFRRLLDATYEGAADGQ